jgi:sugar O-acyltransferase, sialic acid O-acetyltransferase neuD family|uniref:NeuD/PglB/VioB family sugar acetyltransferase n=1 Tax=unclassified Clostridium TaxID=2614128 RepID=UPI0025D99928|nr:NeuD/PglB/VioB family sugar acetyltransferase [Clostridium sp.]MDY2630708.1 NeuD/PglB/VioB family sugar acetyltransferase [Clostridium sp.]
MENLLIIGAGGHGKVVAEAAELENKYKKISFLDDNANIDKVYNFEVVGRTNQYRNFKSTYKYAFVAIGNNEVRLRFIDMLIEEGFVVPNIIHPKASLSKYSKIDIGTVILSGAIVNVDCFIGKGCILNINSVIDHDSIIGKGVHISSGAVVRSMVKIGELSTIKARACITEGKNIEKESIIESGSII